MSITNDMTQAQGVEYFVLGVSCPVFYLSSGLKRRSGNQSPNERTSTKLLL